MGQAAEAERDNHTLDMSGESSPAIQEEQALRRKAALEHAAAGVDALNAPQ